MWAPSGRSRQLEGSDPGQQHEQVQVSETAHVLGGEWTGVGKSEAGKPTEKQWGPRKGQRGGSLEQRLNGT